MGNVNVGAIKFTYKNKSIFPKVDTQSIDSVPSSAHTGIEVYTKKVKGIAALSLRLYSVNIVQHLGSYLQLDKYPEYYYSE